MSKRRISVLHVYRTYFPDPQGGLQEAIRQICLAVRPLGCESTVFALSPHPSPREISSPEALIVRCRSWAAPASCDLGGRDAFIRFRVLAESADVVHFHFPWPFGDVLHLMSCCSTPAVMTYHSDVVRQKMLGMMYRPLMMRMLKSMSAIVATSPSYARTSEVLTHPMIRPLVRVIPLGISENHCPAGSADALMRRRGLDDGRPFFLFIGVLRYYKGLHYLIEAAAEVDARIVVAGSGPEEEALRQLAEVRGVKNVCFVGQVTDEEKVALLNGCLALVLPSHLRSEAFGMVLVEASIYGKPLVSCDIGTGTSFVNEGGKTGIVVPPESPRALAEAMNLILRDPGLAKSMGEAARERYLRFFSAEALGREYAQLYRDVLPVL